MNSRYKEMIKHGLLILLSIFTLIPFYFLIVVSFKNHSQFLHQFWSPTFPFHFINYVEAWLEVNGYILNTVIYSVSVVVGTLITAATASYIIARYNFPGKEVIFYAIIGLMMIPGILILVPRFLLVRDLGLLDTRLGMILPLIASSQIMGVLILRTFFETISEELFESARIDGANKFQQFYLIAIPLSVPILITVAMITFVATWNQIIWPMVILSSNELKPITTGLMAFQGQYTVTQYGPMFAGYVLGSLPLIIVFAFGANYYIKGLTSGALKG